MIAGIASFEKRLEILYWYHLKENLYKLGGYNQRLQTVETHLWGGQINEAIATLADWDIPHVKNFLDYLERRHRCRIPDYESQKITIGSGAVEATIKQIGRRIKISGAQWNRDNLAQVLKHCCAYLNLALVSIVFILITYLRCSRCFLHSSAKS